MKRYYTIYFIALLMASFGCKNKESQSTEQATEVSADKNDITPKDIESFRFDDYALSNDSKKALENWQKYQELNEQISFIKDADFSFFTGEKNVLKAFLNDFKVEMPETIKTTSIISRITVMETMVLKLNSTLKLDTVDKTTQLKAIKELLIAMSNLNLQINKKFELDANLVDKNDASDIPVSN